MRGRPLRASFELRGFSESRKTFVDLPDDGAAIGSVSSCVGRLGLVAGRLPNCPEQSGRRLDLVAGGGG